MMKKIVLFIPILFISSYAYAESSASVKINNTFSTNSNSKVDSQTDIRVETNGKVTEYSTNETRKIDVNSENGESEIIINGENLSEDTTTKSPTPTITEKKETLNEKSDKQSVFEGIKEIIEKIFSVFD